MNTLSFLRLLLKGNKFQFDVPYKEQKAYLDTLPEPKDKFDRSFFQYKCQVFFYPKLKVLLYDILSFAAFFPVCIYLLIRSLRRSDSSNNEAISNLVGMEEIVPQELLNCYIIKHTQWSNNGWIHREDAKFCIGVFLRFFPNPYFSLKTLVLVGKYCRLIDENTPLAVITHGEFSFCSSILTEYCNRRGVKHINVMHGEKLYFIRDSFFQFDICYVWDKHYEKLFKSMKAESSQFIVAVPISMRIDTVSYFDENCFADYKYYLANETEDSIKSIVESMQFVKQSGKKVKYRLHPRYKRMDIVEKYIPASEIEDPHQVSILQSVASCNYAVGCYSTVLTQAYLSGKQVILDDVSLNNKYKYLADLGYLLAEKNCLKLSDLQ